MSGLLIVFAAIIVVAVLDILSQTHGVDSRPDFEDGRAPACGIS